MKAMTGRYSSRRGQDNAKHDMGREQINTRDVLAFLDFSREEQAKTEDRIREELKLRLEKEVWRESER